MLTGLPISGLLLLCAMACALRAEDWPGFRGPNGSGVATQAKDLPVRFDESSLRWTAPVPFGRSSPAVLGDRVILSAADGETLMVISLHADTGKEQWRYTRTRTRRNEIDANRNDAACGTPAVTADGVYAFFGDYGLIALDPRTGKLQWEMPLGPFTNNYGMGTSPVLAGGTVFLQIDARRGSVLLAVDRRTGKVRWKTARPETVEGWSTPLFTPHGDIVALSSNGLQAFSAETGESRWLVPAPDSLMIPMPVLFDNNHILAPIRGSAQPAFPDWAWMLKADADADGKLVPAEAVKRFPAASFGIADSDRDGVITEAEWLRFRNRGVGDFGFSLIRLSDRKVVWRYQKGLPYVPSPIAYQGLVYAVRTGGILLALDGESGALLKEARLPEAGGDYFASLIAGDGKIYAASADGKLTVIQPGRDWEVIATADLGDTIFATPAIARNALFVRTQRGLRCYR